MAERARLIPPPSEMPSLSWDLRTGDVKLSSVAQGDRRLEAGSYLTDGYGIMQMLRGRGDCIALSELADIWQPNRLKGVQVGPSHGTAFLAATQVFDIRPIARKWLALERTQAANERFVAEGTILVTCSGTVGRATVAFAAHSKVLISHDLLRVEPRSNAMRGWIYAYLRAPKARAMMQSAHYGHMIKHLETSHLNALPIPSVDPQTVRTCQNSLNKILKDRNEADKLILEAEEEYEKALGLTQLTEAAVGFEVSASDIGKARRRLDAAFSAPAVSYLRQMFETELFEGTTLAEAGYEAWLPNRFQRVPASDGVELVSSSSLFEINPDKGELIADRGFGDSHKGRVKAGWLLIARSGQNYGIVGSVAMAMPTLAGKVVSDHVVRLAPGSNATLSAGYVLIALSHPTLGRPLLKALPTGSSIPSIDFEDVLALRVPIVNRKQQEIIGDKVDRAFKLRAKADTVEDEMGSIADARIAG